MRIPVTLLTAASMLAPALPAGAEPLSIGVAAPVSGANTPQGNHLVAGPRPAAAVAGPARIRLQPADDACTAAGGRAAAERFVAAEVRAVVGFLCAEAIDAAMPALHAAGIPVIAVGARSGSLTDARAKTGWVVARLGPRADEERQAAGRLLADLWRDTLFAIVDDGTIYGRELAEAVREGTESAGLKPVFTDTFRPGSDNQIALVGRLARAGATQVFVGGERGDVGILARDAARLAPGTVFAGGEALRDDPGAVELAPGTLMVGLPEPAGGAAPSALDAIRAQGVPPEGYAVTAFAAVEIAEKALASAQPQPFGTALGPVSFDGKGDLAENPYRLFRFDGRHFVPFDAP